MLKTFLKIIASTFCFFSIPADAATNVRISDIIGAEYDTAGVYIKDKVQFTGTDDDADNYDSVYFKIFDDNAMKF